jgi:hypothetical protein
VLGCVPDFVTHYYRLSRRPFLNLSDLPESEAIPVMLEMIDERAAAFSIGRLVART